MPITNPQPLVIEGITYDLLSVQLAMSTSPRNGEMVLDIATTLEPYREGPGGPEVLETGKATLVYADAMRLAAQAAQRGDTRLAEFLEDLLAAGQKFINSVV